MNCPVCDNKNSSVIDTRPADDGFSIRRRRECDKCHYRFSTVEEVELLDIVVVKRNGQREGYSRDKINSGIKMALSKRSYLQDDFYRLVNSIERDIQKKKSREISSKEIGDIIMKYLRSFDKVAYIRFASVYRDFRDVRTFSKELKKITK
jgi:transcriptional repressor NrdR